MPTPQESREAEAFDTWPEFAPLVTPLAAVLETSLEPSKAEGQPQVKKGLRGKLKRVGYHDLAATVVRAVIKTLWGQRTEPRVEGVVVQEVGRRVGMAALRAYMRVSDPDLSPQAADEEIERKWSLGQRTTLGWFLTRALGVSRLTLPPLLKLLQPLPPQPERKRSKAEKMFRFALAPDARDVFGLATFVRSLDQRPMLESPLPWGPGQRGGYRYALKGSVPLVSGVRAAEGDPLCSPSVYDALNTLQATPWRINNDVLEAAEAVRAEYLA